MDLKEQRQNFWNESYENGGNILFYPHEEIVRFVNKYVRKRTGVAEFKNIMQLTDSEWMNFKSLDLGCGIGRHMKFLDEFGLNPYGIDLSSEAIRKGKQWMCSLNKQSLAEKMVIGSVTELPYEDSSFNIVVSHSVLDSMPMDMAQKGFIELLRVAKEKGMMYLDFYLNFGEETFEELVQEGFARNTIGTHYTVKGIKEFIGDKADIVEFKIARIMDADGRDIEYESRAHLVIQKNT